MKAPIRDNNGGAPAPLAPAEIAQAVREYRMRKQRLRAVADPATPPWKHQPPKPVSLWTDLECISYLTFTCETVAHLQAQERVLLPITDRVRQWLEEQSHVSQAELSALADMVLDGRISVDVALQRAARIGRQEERDSHDKKK